METLIQRLEEVMREMGWEQADLRRVSGQSSSTVSQWMGNSSKLIKSIGKMEAAEAIERESGFCALWIAKGIGPKKVAAESQVGGTYAEAAAEAALFRRWREEFIHHAKLYPNGGVRSILLDAVQQVDKTVFVKSDTNAISKIDNA